MHDEVVALLRCPHCGDGLAAGERTLRCPAGHVFDVARQGYVSLLPGRAASGDDAEMVAARSRFLDAAHYDPLVEEVAALAAELRPDATTVLDAGTGTGHYLAALLDRLPEAVGLGLDASKHAARRAARVHPRAGAAVTDLWQPWPVRDGVADLLLDVFAPRNGPEFQRVLAADGVLVVARPTDEHLAELTTALGMLAVDADKDTRLERTLGGRFVEVARRHVRVPLELSHEATADLVRMGPSVHHLDVEEVDRRVAALPTQVRATATIVLTGHRPDPPAGRRPHGYRERPQADRGG